MNKTPHFCEIPAPPAVNPATGLPMIDNAIDGVDVAGSPFGVDLHDDISSRMGEPFVTGFEGIFGPFD